ncbi:hypothetical protein [Escherichia coli]|uniref:hypothetical protein n=1 Tax=Escherichia coli TaxID=562 RepID=UPI00234F2269|nr:hypothetical protein [Escherichia coli]WCQ45937.1 hypothetical protein NL420_007740 [Escherichia coli]
MDGGKTSAGGSIGKKRLRLTTISLVLEKEKKRSLVVGMQLNLQKCLRRHFTIWGLKLRILKKPNATSGR